METQRVVEWFNGVQDDFGLVGAVAAATSAGLVALLGVFFILFLVIEFALAMYGLYRRTQMPHWSVMIVVPGVSIQTVGTVRAEDEDDAKTEFALSRGFEGLEDYERLALPEGAELMAVPYGKIPDRIGPREIQVMAQRQMEYSPCE